jgi:hygromycin-B 4-O-kinase
MAPGKTDYSIEQVRQFLAGRYGDDVGDVQLLKGGCWSAAYAFRSGERDRVVRFAPEDSSFRKDQVAASYASKRLPIPRVELIGEAFGGYFAISERAFGEMLDDLSADRMRRVVPAIFGMLDALRAVDLSSTQGIGGWDAPGIGSHESWRDCLLEAASDPPGSFCHGWRAALARSSAGDAAFLEAFERLEQLAEEPPDGRHLIHNDLLHWNVLVSGDEIAGVIDWQCSLYGDFLYDLALLAYGAPWFPAMDEIDWEGEARLHFRSIGLDVPKLEERLLCCQIHVGLGAQQWTAYTQDWNDLERHARRTLELARG